MHVQQNDPDEILEIFDASGRGSGRSKSRAAIHLDGDWHATFQCWILRRNGQEVILQRRALAKDTFAGLWDAAAAGHWPIRQRQMLPGNDCTPSYLAAACKRMAEQ